MFHRVTSSFIVFGRVHSRVLVRTAHCWFSLIFLINALFCILLCSFFNFWLQIVPASLWPLGPYLTTKCFVIGQFQIRRRYKEKFHLWLQNFSRVSSIRRRRRFRKKMGPEFRIETGSGSASVGGFSDPETRHGLENDSWQRQDDRKVRWGPVFENLLTLSTTIEKNWFKESSYFKHNSIFLLGAFPGMEKFPTFVHN